MRQILRRFLTDEEASAAAEYGMITAIIALVAIIVISNVGINFMPAFKLLRTIATGSPG